MVRMFKFFQTLLIVAGIAWGLAMAPVSTASARSHHNGGGSSVERDPGDGGGSFPWPWSLAIPFPWKDIQGVWRAERYGRVFYFGFRRVTGFNAENRLIVKEFDAEECSTAASGVGFENSKSVVAQMSAAQGSVYRLSLSAFNEEDVPEPPVALGGSHVMVARVSNLANVTVDLTVQMVKISSALEFKCQGSDKKIKF